MKSQSKFLEETSKKDSILANVFWTAFTIYCLAVAYTGTADPNYIIAQAAQLTSLAVMLPSLFFLIKFKIKNDYLRIVYLCYCLWLFVIVLMGSSEWTNYDKLKLFLFDPVVGLIYFAPMVMLIPLNANMLKKLFTVITVYGIAYLILDLLFIKYLIIPNRTDTLSQGVVEHFADICYSCGFILFTYFYHTKKRNLIAFTAMFASLLFATIQARRGLIFMFSLMFIISYLIFTFYSKHKAIILYFTIFLSILAAFYVIQSYKIKSSNLFGFVLDRGSEDTRTNVEIYFYDDFKLNDWIIGRGIFGSYFCPNIEENQETNNRELIETGYLHTILKGGIVSLGLFTLISVPAVFLGLFYSRNILSKASGIWIAMALLNSYPTIQNAFNLNYLLIWICIGICYNKEIRKMSEDKIIQGLKTFKLKQA